MSDNTITREIAELIKAHRVTFLFRAVAPNRVVWICKTKGCEYECDSTVRAFDAEARHQADVIVAALQAASETRKTGVGG